jgi:hypothetical protein
MKTRLKLLLAGVVLVAATLRPAPAEARCFILPFMINSEEECEQICYGSDCYSYFFDGGTCYCS